MKSFGNLPVVWCSGVLKTNRFTHGFSCLRNSSLTCQKFREFSANAGFQTVTNDSTDALNTPLNLTETDPTLSQLQRMWTPKEAGSSQIADECPLRLDDSWSPSSELRQVIYALHQTCLTTEKRLSLWSDSLLEHSLKGLEWKLDNVAHLHEIGFEREMRAIARSAHRLERKALTPMHDLLDAMEQLQNTAITKERLECCFALSNATVLATDNTICNVSAAGVWPAKMESSGTYELNNVEWCVQLRTVQFTQPTPHFKLGLFVGPKTVASASKASDLKATIDLNVTVDSTYKWTEELQQQMNERVFAPSASFSVEGLDDTHLVSKPVESIGCDAANDGAVTQRWTQQSESDSFRVNASFIRDANKLMSWGKFIPLLQNAIDPQSGALPANADQISVKIDMRVLTQKIRYVN